MRRALAVGLVCAFACALPGAAWGASETTGWDGVNPFLCTLQQLGMGAEFPQPDADPFCVEYDKTHQNVAPDGGVVQFLSLEPARVAAASPKCFYFQRDHWRGSVVQDNAATETYAWDGSYYFDKARGAGGVYVENFRIAGQTGDPSALPGFPEEWKPYFSNGRGGVQAVGDVQADPSCAARPNPGGETGGGPGGSGGGPDDHCRVPGGRVRRGKGGIAGLRLRMQRARARKTLGLPATENVRFAVWCFTGGDGRLVGGFSGRDPQRGRADFVWTNSHVIDLRGVRVGAGQARLRKRVHGLHRLGRVRGVTVLARRDKRRRVMVGLRGGRVTFLAVSRRAIRPRRALRYVKNVP